MSWIATTSPPVPRNRQISSPRSDTFSGLRRPSESDSGPTISWPNASPASVPVRVNCVTDDVTDSSSVIRGSAGK